MNERMNEGMNEQDLLLSQTWASWMTARGRDVPGSNIFLPLRRLEMAKGLLCD